MLIGEYGGVSDTMDCEALASARRAKRTYIRNTSLLTQETVCSEETIFLSLIAYITCYLGIRKLSSNALHAMISDNTTLIHQVKWNVDNLVTGNH